MILIDFEYGKMKDGVKEKRVLGEMNANDGRLTTKRKTKVEK